jgi:hypothetical protein
MTAPKLKLVNCFFWVLLLVLAALLVGMFSNPAAAAESRSGETLVALADESDTGTLPPSARTRRRDDTVTFRYLDDGFYAVDVTGSFNGWEPVAMTLDPETDIWSVSLSLDPGRHRYQFLVEDDVEAWEAIDPSNSHARLIDEHGWVSLITVPDQDEIDDDEAQDETDTSQTTFNINLNLDSDDEDDWDRRRQRFVRRELNRHYDDPEDNASFQRVDGLSIGIHPTGISRDDFGPAARGLFSYGFRREEWTLGGVLIQPLLANHRMLVKVTGHSGTDFQDNTGIGGMENSLAAVFFREDYRDYFDREGVTVSLVGYPMSTIRLEAGYESSDYQSLATRETWSFADGTYHDNPAVDEGTLRSYFANVMIGTRNNHLLANWEAGQDKSGDRFDYELVKAAYRGRVRMSGARYLDFRTLFATGLKGELPMQRRFPVGGLGTVRGYTYQSLLTPDPDALTPSTAKGGQRMVVANFEYGFSFDTNIVWTRDDDDDWGDFEGFDTSIDSALFLFFDAGMAWENRSADFDLEDLKSSAGIGFRFDDDGPRIDFIRTLEGGGNTLVQIRLERTF